MLLTTSWLLSPSLHWKLFSHCSDVIRLKPGCCKHSNFSRAFHLLKKVFTHSNHQCSALPKPFNPIFFTRSSLRCSALPGRLLPWQICACPTWGGDQIQVAAIFTLMKMIQLYLVQIRLCKYSLWKYSDKEDWVLPCANTGLQAEGEFWEVDESLLASVRSVECKGLDEEINPISKVYSGTWHMR